MQHSTDIANRIKGGPTRGIGPRSIYLCWALFVISNGTTGGALALNVSVSAKPLSIGSEFEAFVDARSLPRPYDMGNIVLRILCHTPNGSKASYPVLFHENYLARGRLYRKTLSWPANCAEWIRLDDASVSLLVGKTDGPSASVSVNQGAINGSAANLSPPLAAPQLTGPSHGSVFNYYPRHITLRWAPVRGAYSYTVLAEMGYQGQWSSYLNVPNIKTTSYSFKFVGAQPGRWRVWAVTSDGSIGQSSGWWEFRFTQ